MTPDELRLWREEHNLTREELAGLLSPSKRERLSFRTVERWEHGRSAKIPVFLRLALAEVERKITPAPEPTETQLQHMCQCSECDPYP